MTVGQQLREARERQKVSLHAIAEKTNISVRFLDAIEKNQFGKLPGGIFTRGFIRSYAAQVGLDPDAAVQQFLSDEPDARDESDDPITREREGLGLVAVLLAALVLIAVTVVLVYVFAPDWLRRSGPSAAMQPEMTVTEPRSSAGAQGAPTPVAAPALAASPEAPAPAAPLPLEATAATLTEAAVDRSRAPLHLVVTPAARCWVQVSADGQVRVSRELSAGEQVSVEASERLQIIAGDAGAFAYTLNGRAGKPLGPSGSVARVSIVPTTAASFQAP